MLALSWSVSCSEQADLNIANNAPGQYEYCTRPFVSNLSSYEDLWLMTVRLANERLRAIRKCPNHPITSRSNNLTHNVIANKSVKVVFSSTFHWGSSGLLTSALQKQIGDWHRRINFDPPALPWNHSPTPRVPNRFSWFAEIARPWAPNRQFSQKYIQ